MKLRLLVSIVVLALLAAVVYRVQQQAAGERRGGGERALAVRAIPVELRDFPRVLDLPGTLEAAQQVAIVAQVGGTVLRQHVEEGDAVAAGQILFTLDARPARARIAQSQASLAGALAEAEEAERQLRRLDPLMTSGYISRQEYEAARVALEAARARAGAARGELEAARLDVAYAAIRAPIAGRVGRITVRPGSLVQAGGDPLTTLVAPGTLDVRASVAQQDWPELAAARERGRVMAEVFLDTHPGARARGELVFVDTQIDAPTGAVPIKVRLADPPLGLLSGQSVRVRLLLGSDAGARVVPEAALQRGQTGSYVYVVRDGKAVVQPVTSVRSLDGEHMVEGELRAGERVLTEIPQRLKAGDAVKLEPAAGAGARTGTARPR